MINSSLNKFEITKPPLDEVVPEMKHQKLGNPCESYQYVDTDGSVMFYIARYENQEGQKTFLPWCWSQKTKSFVCKAWPENRPIYNQQELAERETAPVLVVEGEKAANAARSIKGLPYVVTTWSGGASAVSKSNFEILRGRKVLLWPDADEAGIRAMNKIAEQLWTFSEVKVLDVADLPKGWDAADAIAEGWDWPMIFEWAKPRASVFIHKEESEKKSSQQDIKSSVADELIELASSSADLFHDLSDDGYASLSFESRVEIWPIKSEGFKKWLRNKYYKKYTRSCSDVSVNTALEGLTAIAVNEGETHEVFLRVANVDGSYYIDLADDSWRAVKVNRDGWELLNKSPVKFIRTSNSRPLPTPVPGSGDVDLLWEHVNFRREDQDLLLASILESFRPNTPFVIQVYLGEQGSAKSTSQWRIRDLIDPSRVMLRTAPKTPQDIAIAAYRNWVVSYENLSSLTAEQQDMCCVVLTGGGVAGRQLYTNYDESAIEVKRPLIMNGISAFVTRPDLLDRSVIFELPTISDSTRLEQALCDEKWEKDRSKIFSGILDLFADTLRALPAVRFESAPRMVDFAKLGEAMVVARKKTPGTFLKYYTRARKNAIDIVLDGDVVAIALEEFISKQDNFGVEISTKLLFEKLQKHQFGTHQHFPKSPRGLGNALRRLAPVFRQHGWEITQDRKEDGVRVSIIPLSKE
ncbi:MAG: hypothetical protein VKK42_32305 [Lyngbya sp.]|nr:hypothetical protein [Lyngbya sp.]